MRGLDIAEESVELSEAVKLYRGRIGVNWIKDEAFFEKFFPVTPALHPTLANIRQKLYNGQSKRKKWKYVPENPPDYRHLIKPLTSLFNAILTIGNISSGRRTFLNTHNVHIDHVQKLDFSPSILLVGAGSEFANYRYELPYASYSCGISPIEVCLDSIPEVVARDRLAVFVHQILHKMESRRFAFGFVITQSKVTVYMFDRAGVLFSGSLNYLENPEQFSAIILGLAGDGPQIGLDWTCWRDLEHNCFRLSTTEKHQEYQIIQCLVRHPNIPGRGTIVWKASDRANPSMTYIIKDTWVQEEYFAGWEPEASFLEHAQKCCVTKGVVHLHHYEKVKRSSNDEDYDSVIRNRKTDVPVFLDRFHIRLILSPVGIPLVSFQSCRQLLVGLLDAVQGHYDLYTKAGILHRDIAPSNIVLDPDGREGRRGILVDFEHSIRVSNIPSSRNIRQPIGTTLFMSRNVLRGGLHTYRDDLESFYYVLVFMIVSFDAPGVWKEDVSPLVEKWGGPDALVSKKSHFSNIYDIPIPEFMGSPIDDLARGFHGFLTFHRALGAFEGSTDEDVARDYSKVLAIIRNGLEAWDKQPVSPFPSISGARSPNEKERDASSVSKGLDIDIPKKRRRRHEPLPPRQRLRRAVAKYL